MDSSGKFSRLAFEKPLAHSQQEIHSTRGRFRVACASLGLEEVFEPNLLAGTSSHGCEPRLYTRFSVQGGRTTWVFGHSRIRGGNFHPKPGRGYRFSQRSCKCLPNIGLAYLNQVLFS